MEAFATEEAFAGSAVRCKKAGGGGGGGGGGSGGAGESDAKMQGE